MKALDLAFDRSSSSSTATASCPPARRCRGRHQGGLWTQVVSDVTGREQQVPEQTIGASYGDALMAAIESDSSHRNRLGPPGTNPSPRPGDSGNLRHHHRGYCDLYPPLRRPLSTSLLSRNNKQLSEGLIQCSGSYPTGLAHVSDLQPTAAKLRAAAETSHATELPREAVTLSRSRTNLPGIHVPAAEP